MREFKNYNCTGTRIPLEESTREFIKEFVWRSLQGKNLDEFIDVIYGPEALVEAGEIDTRPVIAGGFDRIINGVYGAFILFSLILEKEQFNQIVNDADMLEPTNDSDKLIVDISKKLDRVVAKRVFLDSTQRQITFDLAYEKWDCCNGNFEVSVIIPLTNVYDDVHNTQICKAGENVYRLSIVSRDPQNEFDDNEIFKVYNNAVKNVIPPVLQRLYTSMTNGCNSTAKHCDACIRMGVQGDECEVEKDILPINEQIKYVKNEKNGFVSDDFKVLQIALTDEDINLLKLRRFNYANIANTLAFVTLCAEDEISHIKSTDDALGYSEECDCECDCDPGLVCDCNRECDSECIDPVTIHP